MHQNSAPFKPGQYFPLCQILLNHLLTDGNLNCFHISTDVNTAAIALLRWIGEQTIEDSLKLSGERREGGEERVII